MRRSCALFLICSLLCALPVLAQDLKAGTQASDTVDIEADRLDVSTTDGTAVFRGNVKAVRADIVVRGDILSLAYDQKTRKVATLTAEGGVSLQWKGREASCEKVVYDLTREVMTLTGGVVITQGQERLSGQKVTLDLKNDTQVVEGGGGRVNVRVNTGESTGIMQWQK